MSRQHAGRQCEDSSRVSAAWRMLTLAASAALLLYAGQGRAAVLLPAVTVTVDGTAHSVPLTQVAKGTGAAPAWVYVIDNYSVAVQDEYSFTISSARLDPDPSIAYVISVVDFGAPSTFGFLFGTPIVPTGTPNLVSASLSGTLTDGGGGVLAIAPVPGPKIQSSQLGPTLTNMGVDVDIGESFGPLAGPAGTWTFLQVNAGFQLSGGGDLATLNGFAGIVEGQLPPNGVPEPGSLALLGIALAAAAAARRGKNA